MEKSKLHHFDKDKLLKCPFRKKNLKQASKTAPFCLKLGFPYPNQNGMVGIKKKKKKSPNPQPFFFSLPRQPAIFLGFSYPTCNWSGNLASFHYFFFISNPK
jgi:hypothetical protein